MTVHIPDDFDPEQPLLPYQRRWIADRSRLKVAEKSRRTGITWATSLEGVLTSALSPSAGGQDTWYTITHEDDAREFVEDAVEWSKALKMAVSDIGEVMVEDEDKDIQAFRIRFASGFKLTGLSSNVKRLRGKEGLLIADEAAHNENLPELMKAARAYVMWGKGRLVLISSHNGEDSYFNKVIEGIRAGEIEGTLHRITLHDAVRQGLYRRICQKNKLTWTLPGEGKWVEDLIHFYGEFADEELHCIPSGSGGRYLSRRIIEQCMQPAPVHRLYLKDGFATAPSHERDAKIEEFCGTVKPSLDLIPDWAEVYFGEDFGRVSDLTVLAPLYLDDALIRTVPFLVEMKNVPFEEQKKILFFIMDKIQSHKKGGVAGGMFDAGGNGASTAEAVALRYGSSVRAIHLAGGAPRDEDKRSDKKGEHLPSLRYSEFLPSVKMHLERRDIRIPKDRDLLSDLERFEKKDGHPYLPPKKTRGTTGDYRHADAAVAVCLAHYASLGAVSQPGKIFAPRRSRVVHF